MKITAALATTIALAGSAHATGKIRICVNSETYVPFQVLARAEGLSSRMFATAGVSLDWHSAGSAACRSSEGIRAVTLDFSIDTKPAQYPEAMAYALPYRGSRIVVLFDRIERSRAPGQISTVLAHVMTHEITHVLEGIARHSQNGIMKAHWDDRDFTQMGYRPLPFAPEDIDLIQLGLRLHFAVD
jgi:hypothetical protein